MGLIKFRPNGHTYSRVYFLTMSEDAIHYQGSRYRSKFEACMKISKIILISHKQMNSFR